jgi:hypothetical protein
MRPPKKIADSKGKPPTKKESKEKKKKEQKPLPKLLTAAEGRDELKTKHTLDKRREAAAKIKQKKII